MKLTRTEENILAGRYGKFMAEALDFLVQFGEAFDAERFVDISYVHYPAEMSIYKGDVEQAVGYAKKGAKVCVPTTTTTLACDLEQWDTMGCPKELADKQREAVAAHKKMGVLQTYTCTPYLLGYIPSKGSRIAATESSAVVYFNSVLGARTNRGGQFTRLAAIVGKYPEIGYLLTENRKGTHLFRIDMDSDDLKALVDWSLLGFVIGKIVGGQVPVITNLPSKRCQQEQLIALGASLATAGSVALYHIPGITPEANTVEEAFHFGPIPNPITITKNEIIGAKKSLSNASGSEIDFVALGCPHYNLSQIQQVAQELEGKKVAKNVRLWVSTNRMTKRAAQWEGFAETIEKAGGFVICDTCPVEAHMRKSTCIEYGLKIPQIERLITDSTKMAHYVKDLIGCETYVADFNSCIKSAIKGNWNAD